MEGDAGRCPDSPIWDFRAVPRSVAGEVVGFAPEPFSTSRKVSPRSVAGRCPDLPSGHFWTVPRSDAGIAQICLKGIFELVLGSDAGLCILLIQGFAQGHPLEPHKELTMFNQRILSLDHPY